MRDIHFVITNYSDLDISKIPFDKYDELCDRFDCNPSYYIVSNKKQAECEKAVSMVFENDNENSAISKALTGLKGRVIILSTVYMDRLDVLEEFLHALSSGCHFVRVRRAFRGIASVVSEFAGKIYNIFVKQFTGARDVECIKNFVAFNEVVLELINLFPNKFGIIANSNLLANLNVHEVMVEAEFKCEKNKLSFVGELIFGIIFSLLSVASLVLIFCLPLKLNTILWLLIAVLVFALLGATFCSKNALDNKMLCKTKKSKNKNTKQEKQEEN